MDETINEEGATAGGPIEQIEGDVRKVLLAGVGAVAVACDTAQEKFDYFVQRGEEAQQEMTERRQEMRAQRAETRSRMVGYFRGAMDQFLNALNIPSKSDVDTINVKLNIVNRKLDEIQMEEMARVNQAAESPSEPPPPPPISAEEI